MKQVLSRDELYKKEPASSFIFLTGLLVGTLDAIAAIINYSYNGGKHPEKIFQYIASGVFDKTSHSSTAMIVIGIIFHYLIAMSFTVFYFLVCAKNNFTRNNKIIAGVIYGLFIWAVMEWVVVPMSNVNQFPFKLSQALIGAGILILAIGIPVSLLSAKYYSNYEKK
ncbi:MAG: hypothetical protein H0W12_07515 [Chitinophagaceae bacterium]|nr:hypothetical protein [Chitinophagaceae bacterium]